MFTLLVQVRHRLSLAVHEDMDFLGTDLMLIICVYLLSMCVRGVLYVNEHWCRRILVRVFAQNMQKLVTVVSLYPQAKKEEALWSDSESKICNS